MEKLRKMIEKEILLNQGRNKELLKNHKDVPIGNITTEQLFSGLRGVKSIVCNTSYVDPNEGLIIKGNKIADISDKKAEEVFYLLCTGQIPDEKELSLFQEHLASVSDVPEEIFEIIYEVLPENTHPMTMFSIAIMLLEKGSIFKEKYASGLRKNDFWKSTLDDSIELIAKVPAIAAAIFKKRYEREYQIPVYDANLDWASNFANMLDLDNNNKEFCELMRLYMILHCDHEGGNASAFTTRVVNSTLANIYLSVSAGLNALAGPLHGLANQESLKYVLSIYDKFEKVPTEQELSEYVKATLNLGKVVPGYGHAVLRKTDPRFLEILKFADKYVKNDDLVEIVKLLYKVVPDILIAHGDGKISCPYPNIDAISGAVLYHYGVTRFEYYTVIFGVSRILGFCAQSILARGVGAPIIRPKSITNNKLKEYLDSLKK